MELVVISFVAGAMTVLAPCILSLLPIIVGGSLDKQRQWRKPFIIAGSLALSVVLFTLLLKLSTSLLGVPLWVWQAVSGTIIVALGVSMVWPQLWEPLGARLNIKSGQLLGKASRQQGIVGDVLTGAALGPVFSSCSPTYAFIVAGVLPVSFAAGMAYLVAYALGLAGVLLTVALVGQRLVTKMRWASNPNGWFKRTIGALFIIVGVGIATGLDHKLQTFLVEQGWYDPFSQLETNLLPK